MREAVRKKLAKAAKKGKRIVIASFAGAIALSSNISYAQELGIEDVFDEHYYADQYSDLKNVYGYAKALLLDHFMKFGISEGRQMNELIDIIEYRLSGMTGMLISHIIFPMEPLNTETTAQTLTLWITLTDTAICRQFSARISWRLISITKNSGSRKAVREEAKLR